MSKQSEFRGSISYTLLGALCVSQLYMVFPSGQDAMDLDAITALVAQSSFRAKSVVR